MKEIQVPENIQKVHIKPYKLNSLMKAAAKITDLLIKTPEFVLTYEDIEFVLDTVNDAVRRAERGERGEKHGSKDPLEETAQP